MRASKNFTYGTESDRIMVAQGEEIPEEILADLDDSFILEKVAKSNPSSLSREQLMELAGLNDSDDSEEDEEDPDSDEEFDEDEFREGLDQFDTKQALIDWVKEVFGVKLDKDDTRAQLEDQAVAIARGDVDEEEG